MNSNVNTLRQEDTDPRSSMFNGKSPATFFVKLFDKEKDANDNNTKEDIDENIEDQNGVEGRKRSQSMFAPSVTSLLAGNHIGGKGDILFSSNSDPEVSGVWLSINHGKI